MVLVTVDQTQSRCLSPLLLPSARASSETSRGQRAGSRAHSRTAPQLALSFFPTLSALRIPKGFPSTSRAATCPGALVFPGKLERLFRSAPSLCRGEPASVPAGPWLSTRAGAGRGLAVGWKGGYSPTEGLSQQRAGFDLFPLLSH